MRQVNYIQGIVERVLQEHIDARNSDTILYKYVCEAVNPMACSMAFATVLDNRNMLGLPNFETCGRVRRKLQATNPAYKANYEVQVDRKVNEQIARAYAAE